MLASRDEGRVDGWEERIFSYLTGFFPPEKYAFLSSVQMVGLLLCVVMSKEHFVRVRKVERLLKKVSETHPARHLQTALHMYSVSLMHNLCKYLHSEYAEQICMLVLRSLSDRICAFMAYGPLC